MNRKQFLEDTVNMLLAQGCYAYKDGVCRYRTEDGKKCAIGVHIPDGVYTPSMEGTPFTPENFPPHKPIRTALEAKYGEMSFEDLLFVRFVQDHVHDKRARTYEWNFQPLLSFEEAKAVLLKNNYGESYSIE